jgi:hypothetical protein
VVLHLPPLHHYLALFQGFEQEGLIFSFRDDGLEQILDNFGPKVVRPRLDIPISVPCLANIIFRVKDTGHAERRLRLNFVKFLEIS